MASDPDAASSPGLSWTTAISTNKSLTEALAEVAARALATLPEGATPDLAVIFVSPRYSVAKFGPLGRESLEDVVPKLRSFIPGLRNVVGCTAAGVVGTAAAGNAEEVEDRAAVALSLAHLPGVEVRTWHALPDEMPDEDSGQIEWRRLIGERETAKAPAHANMLLFADPGFAVRGQLTKLLQGLDFVYPGTVKVGAVASASGPRSGHLFCTTKRDVLMQTSPSLYDSGVVGCVLSGDVELEPVLATGCRAIGPVFVVRRARPNMLEEVEVAGRPAECFSGTGALRYIFERATGAEKELIQNDLVIGVARDEFRDALSEEDFVVRQIIGIDQKSGFLGIAQDLRPGQRVQFQVRDREFADTKMENIFQNYKRAQLGKVLEGNCNPPVGALMFACEGRGVGLFRDPNHDSAMLSRFVNVPVSGLFCSAEVAPQAGTSPTFINNFSTVFTLIKRRSGATQPLEKPTGEGESTGGGS